MFDCKRALLIVGESIKGKEMQDDEFQELKVKAAARKRMKTNLDEHGDTIKKMLDADISLPVIYEWLVGRGVETALTTLRRFVVKRFGESYYQSFVERNGWQKGIRSSSSPEKRLTKVTSVALGSNSRSAVGISSTSFGNPADINNFFNKHKKDS